MKTRLVKIAIGILRDRRTRKAALTVLLVLAFLTVTVPLVTALGPVMSLCITVERICAAAPGVFPGGRGDAGHATAEQLLQALGEYGMTSSEEVSMRMRQEDFEYMLRRIAGYDSAGERSRTVTIQGMCEWDEEVETETQADTYGLVRREPEDDQGLPGTVDAVYEKVVTGTAAPTVTETVHMTEYTDREVTVGNSYYEGISGYDYRLLFLYLALAASDRATSDRTLSAVVPLDADLREITHERDGGDGGPAPSGYMITREDIDRVFTYTSTGYRYYCDLLRDGQDYYTYTACESLPHVTVTEEGVHGETVYHVPFTYMASGRSAWSVTGSIKGGDGTTLEAVEETFSLGSLLQYAETLCAYASGGIFWSFVDALPGGRQLHSRWLEWDAAGMVLAHVDTEPVRLRPAFDAAVTGVRTELYSDIGEAAAAWCYERSCRGHSHDGLPNSDGAWGYSQEMRDAANHADCSSMVSRAYEAAGLQWPSPGGYTTAGFRELFEQHADMVLGTERDARAVLDGTLVLRPGDVILISRTTEWAPKDNHIVMYYGDGCIVHATSSAGHIHVQELNGYLQYLVSEKRRLYMARPYIGLESTVDYALHGRASRTPAGAVTGRGLTAADISRALDGCATEEERSDAFAEIALYYAVQDARASGILPSLTAAQCMLESGLGTAGWQSDITLRLNNFFGMKAGLSAGGDGRSTWESSVWGGESRNMPTWEEDAAGMRYDTVAPFRLYACIDDSFTDHSEYLLGAMDDSGSARRYAGITEAASYSAAAAIVRNGGYATDTRYAEKIGETVRRHGLDRHDGDYMTASVPVPEILRPLVRTVGAGSRAGGTAEAADGERITWDRVSGTEFADSSSIHTGYATMHVPDGANGITVTVNAGHGTEGGSAASLMTYSHPDRTGKVTGGTNAEGAVKSTAVSDGMTFRDGTPERSVTLRCAQFLRDELLARGYSVLMIRDTSCTDATRLDNVARTVMANGFSDAHVAIHWDGDGTESDKGCFYMGVPDAGGYRSMYPVSAHWTEHEALGDALIRGLADAGFRIWTCDGYGRCATDLTQTSYSTVPSVDVELGNQCSVHDDGTLRRQAVALADGIDMYFGR